MKIGAVLDGTWEILEKVTRDPDSSGGNFSVGYLVRDKSGREGYLKALDFEPIIRGSAADPTRLLQALTEGFNFERDLVELCRPMDRVVSGFGDGSTKVDGVFVPYIIFERAENDLRKRINHSAALELAVSMKIMHAVAVGMWQLHSKDVAHQDLKPSNVMLFADESKVGDLGRAAQSGRASVTDSLGIAGDKTYAAPELLYGHLDPDWKRRRLGSDLYLLGSLLVYLVLGQGCTPLLMTALSPAHRPMAWSGSFHEVLPYLQAAFQSVLTQFRKQLPAEFADKISGPMAYLCEPNPEKRGHPINIRLGTPYSLERFHPLFDQLAKRLRNNA